MFPEVRLYAKHDDVESSEFPVDIVVLWVDDSDPDWRVRRERYRQEKDDTGNADYRFRDWGLLKYWFRGIEAFAPWVNKVFLVTCGQRPSWLNASHEKLVLIDHEDYIPDRYLPTFNSNVIEMNLHRIKALSEYFILFNDDMYLTSPTKKVDFFSSKGLPRDMAVLGTIASPGVGAVFPFAQLNNSAIINTHFVMRDVLRTHRDKFFSSQYGKDLLRNIVLSQGRCISMFHNYHLPQPMLKSTLQTIWNLEPEMLDACSRQRFRSREDVSQYLVRMWQCCTGNFEPCSPKRGKYYVIGHSEELHKDIAYGRYKMICANDDMDGIEFEREKMELIDAFHTLLPKASAYECAE